MTKAPHLHHLCKTRAGYCAMWDRKASGEQLQPKPPPEPGWVRFIALFKIPEDAGVGDTVARYAAMLGGEKFKAWSKNIGLPCGCTQRQAEWNRLYPYQRSES